MRLPGGVQSDGRRSTYGGVGSGLTGSGRQGACHAGVREVRDCTARVVSRAGAGSYGATSTSKHCAVRSS